MVHSADAGAPDGDTWVRSALAELSAMPGVHRAGLALAEGGGRRLLFSASDRDNGVAVDWCEVDAYEDVPLNHSVRTGEQVVGTLDHLAGEYPAFIGRQAASTCAIASVPMVSAGHVHGGFALFYDTPQPFDHQQMQGLEDLGARLGAGLRRAQRATTHASRSLTDEPVPEGAMAATYRVVAHPSAVGPARGFMRSSLSGWGVDADTIEDAVLCLSELVTNAVIHTESGCELRVVLDHGVLTTTIRDGGSSRVVDLSRVSVEPLAVHGRGLQIVSAVASRWGSELDAVGMTVWFVLEPTVEPKLSEPV
ncbi:ATP-binding protein [Intrasporangium flavum]|uniref:ATP-binding protein n=1 Tax=Intrasporangium flavum TaxID=1428657 RepID=UPI0009FB8B76|nr:ATP-binding protein [Intrasporangium flavum]